MSEFTPLREAVDALAGGAPSPDVDELRRRATRRGRRRIAMVMAAAVVTVLGATDLAINAQQGDRVAPVGPGPTPTPSADANWPLTRIRAEGTVESEYLARSGITVRLYGRCDESLRRPDVPDQVESVCDPDLDAPIRRAHSRFAVEVSQGGRSSLFTVYGEGGLVVASYGEDAVVYSDHESEVQDLDTDRYRLLRADGRETPLQLLMDAPVPAVPGPGVVVLHFDGNPAEGTSHPFVLDERGGTLRPLETSRSAQDLDRVKRELGAWYPEAGLTWGPNADQSLWFVYHDCTVHWGSGEFYGEGGTFKEHELACDAGFDGAWGETDFTYLTDDMFPQGWLSPGRMAAVEDSDGHLFLHVTLDEGTSWQRLPVSDEAAIPDILRHLG